MAEIMTLGEILVEIMATKENQSFQETGNLTGPYPSGAPAIFINQASKVGSTSGIISVVGEDDFGQINISKLKSDNVDIDNIRIDSSLSTGVAFVTYKGDGSRHFIFHLNNSAAGLLSDQDINPRQFENCKYFHIMGSSIINDNVRKAALKAVKICKANNINISFDPNIRVELLKEDKNAKEILIDIYKQCDIFMPSGEELDFFAPGNSEEERVQKVLNEGKKYVVIKKGENGCSGYSEKESYHLQGLSVNEIDPTGAGDCFGGTFISCLNQNYTLKQALEYSNIAGALAVTKKGPMAGNSTLEEIKQFINL